MKAKLVTAILALSLAIPSPVYADRTDDQIAKIEKQIEILQAQLDKLKKKKGVEAVTGAAETATGDIYAITPISAQVTDHVVTKYNSYDAAPGNVFVIVDLEIENISSEDDYFNWFNFDSYVDGYSVKINSDIVDNLATGDVRAGKKLVASVGYEVPIDWQELEIGFAEHYDRVTVSVTITPDSSIFA